MKKTLIKILDVMALLALLYMAISYIMYGLLVGPGYWGPTVLLILHACAVGAMVYITNTYRRLAGAILLITVWAFGLVAVVLGYAPGEFSDPGALGPKLVMLIYPALFLFMLTHGSRARQKTFFKVIALIFVAGSLGHAAVMTAGTIAASGGALSGPLLILITGVALSLILFPTLYTAYRLRAIDPLRRKDIQ